MDAEPLWRKTVTLMPKISVVIPCYNDAEDVGEALESVLEQTAYDRIREVIVVDDGSTDGSREVLQRYEEANEKVLCVFQENRGPGAARNAGIRRSTGDYIAFLDADDLWLPDKIEKQARFLEKHPEVGLLYTDHYIIELDGTRRRIWSNHYDYRRRDNLERLFTYGGPIIVPSAIVKAECLEEVGLFDGTLPKGQDTDLWLRIAAEYPIHHLPVPLVVRRRRRGSVSADVVEKAKHLETVVEKITEKYPRLEDRKGLRQARTQNRIGLYFLAEGNRARARHAALNAIKADRTYPGGYLVLILSLFPLNAQQMRGLLSKLRLAKSTVLRAVK